MARGTSTATPSCRAARPLKQPQTRSCRRALPCLKPMQAHAGVQAAWLRTLTCASRPPGTRGGGGGYARASRREQRPARGLRCPHAEGHRRWAGARGCGGGRGCSTGGARLAAGHARRGYSAKAPRKVSRFWSVGRPQPVCTRVGTRGCAAILYVAVKYRVLQPQLESQRLAVAVARNRIHASFGFKRWPTNSLVETRRGV